MPRQTKPLSEAEIKRTKETGKRKLLFDGDGLYLEISPTGARLWRLKYRVDGQEKRMALGKWPEVSLEAARELRAEARKLVRGGVDPVSARKSEAEAEKVAREEREVAAEKQAVTFRDVALGWYATKEPEYAPTTRKRMSIFLENDILPVLGDRPIAEIKTAEIVALMNRIKDRGSLTVARRVRGICSDIFVHAIVLELVQVNPAIEGLSKVILGNHTVKHRAALREPEQVAELLKAIDAFGGQYVTQCALRLLPLVAVRPGELRLMEWAEVDFEKALWTVPAGRMKMRQPHLVPLSKQAITILSDLHRLTGPPGKDDAEGLTRYSQGRNGKEYVFPGVRSLDRPISDMTLNAALRRLDFGKEEMSSHGWRAIFRTLADEVLKERVDLVEHQLAHKVHGPLGRAYNRTSFLADRTAMMQRWADYLDSLKAEKPAARGKLLQFPGGGA